MHRMTQNDSEGYIMFSNPQEGPESSTTFALLMFVILAQTDQCPGGVLGVWPSYRTRDNRLLSQSTTTQKRGKQTSGELILYGRHSTDIRSIKG